MAELNKKLRIKGTDGKTTPVTIYTTEKEAGANNFKLRTGDNSASIGTCYCALGEIDGDKATKGRIKKTTGDVYAIMSERKSPVPFHQDIYATPGSYQWTPPDGVDSVTAFVLGAGESGSATQKRGKRGGIAKETFSVLETSPWPDQPDIVSVFLSSSEDYYPISSLFGMGKLSPVSLRGTEYDTVSETGAYTNEGIYSGSSSLPPWGGIAVVSVGDDPYPDYIPYLLISGGNVSPFLRTSDLPNDLLAGNSGYLIPLISDITKAPKIRTLGFSCVVEAGSASSLEVIYKDEVSIFSPLHKVSLSDGSTKSLFQSYSGDTKIGSQFANFLGTTKEGDVTPLWIKFKQ